MMMNMKDVVRTALLSLTAKEERIVRLRYGIGCDAQTLEEIGQYYCVTRERIRQQEVKALQKLTSPKLLKSLGLSVSMMREMLEDEIEMQVEE